MKKPDGQMLKRFRVEVWKLRWPDYAPGEFNPLPTSNQTRFLFGCDPGVYALDSYGAACFVAGRYGLRAGNWHDMDGNGKPLCVIRVFESDRGDAR